jgi:hypothetical protein
MTTDVDDQREPGDILKKTIEENTKPGELFIKDLGVASKKTQGASGLCCEGGSAPFNKFPV